MSNTNYQLLQLKHRECLFTMSSWGSIGVWKIHSRVGESIRIVLLNGLQDDEDELDVQELKEFLLPQSFVYILKAKTMNEVNEIRVESLAHIANPLALFAQQQPVYHPRNHPNHYTQNSSTRSQQAATKNTEEEYYKPTNNNLRTSSNTGRANQDNYPRINRGTGYNNQRAVNVVGDKENIQEVTPDAADNSGPIFDIEPLYKVHNDNDNYNVFANDREHPEQPESVNDTYLEEQGDTNITIDSLDMSYDREQDDQDDNDDLAKERDLLASLIAKLKCEIDDNKNRNKFLETLNKALVDILKGEIEAFKTKNKSLESSNNHFKEANNELSKTNQLMFKDLKKFQAKLDEYRDVNYASKVATDCAKAKGDLMLYKMESEKSFNEYTRKINDFKNEK
ncbi:hypothetical protein Tco_1182709 [Tanacetum coccineum]